MVPLTALEPSAPRGLRCGFSEQPSVEHLQIMTTEGWSVPSSTYGWWLPILSIFSVMTAIVATAIVSYIIFFTPWALLWTKRKRAPGQINKAPKLPFSQNSLWRSNGAMAEMTKFLSLEVLQKAAKKTQEDSKPKPHLDGLLKKRITEGKESTKLMYHLGDAVKEVDFSEYISKFI
uniref:Calglandulin n=1 Tax=Steinernema glaseri TaxID=37863 RepID=A0A1I7Z2J6_9BILA